ncbi:unnamed protein product [Effrenium voratum]|nr:unnamed protein product [Effrenium voratum]
MPFVQISPASGGHQVYYRLYPEGGANASNGRPKVLLLMGLGGIHGLWKFQSEFLQQFCDVCALDNRGTGYSAQPRGEMRWTTARMAADSLAVMDHLGWEKVHIVGISMGGMIAQELAILAPERTASLALLATYSSARLALPTVKALLDLLRSTGWLTRDMKEMARASMRLNFPEDWLVQTQSSELHEGKEVTHQRRANKALILMALEVPPELKSKGFKPPPRTHPDEMAKQLTAVLTHHVGKGRCAELRRRKVPVLVLTGSQDCLVRPVNSTIIAEHFDTQVHVLDGVGHGLIFQDADAVNRLLESNIRAGERHAPPEVTSKL